MNSESYNNVKLWSYGQLNMKNFTKMSSWLPQKSYFLKKIGQSNFIVKKCKIHPQIITQQL